MGIGVLLLCDWVEHQGSSLPEQIEVKGAGGIPDETEWAAQLSG